MVAGFAFSGRSFGWRGYQGAGVAGAGPVITDQRGAMDDRP